MKLAVQITIDATITSNTMDEATALGMQKVADIMKTTAVQLPGPWVINKLEVTSHEIKE